MMASLRHKLGGVDFWKPAIRLGFPVALQNLLASSFALVDTLMVGQLGDVAVASVGMAGQWSWLMHIAFYGLSSGTAVFLSQYWGAKDYKGIRRSYGILTGTCLSVSVLMLLMAVLFPSAVMRLFTGDPLAIEAGVSYLRIAGFSYLALAFSQVFSTVLRSTEEVRLPMVASVCGVIVNTILNYGLIFGKLGMPQMGVSGAALATVVSAWTMPAVLFCLSWRRKNLLICRIRDLFSFNGPFVRKFFVISLPVLANELIWALGTTGYNMVFGRISTEAYAALTIYRTIEAMFFAFYIGMCHACGVLVGREIGAGRIDEGVRYGNRFSVVLPLMSVGLSAVMIFTRGLFLRLFDVSPDVARLAKTILLIYALEAPIRNIPFITICGVFRSGGDTRTGVRYDLLSVWAMALPVTVLAGLVLKLDFLWVFTLMLVFEDWLKAFLCIRWLRGKKWVRPVVDRNLG